MPAHTFLQLGFWDEAAATDQASWNASIAWAKRRGLPITSRDFHSLAWLQYEWTQQGRFSKTKEAIGFVNDAMRGSSPQAREPASPLHSGGHGYGEGSEIGRGSNEAALRNDRGSMRARYIIESERWSEMKGQSTFDNIEELFALGLSAVNLGDAARVRVVIDEFRKASAPAQPAELREQAAVMLAEMEALDQYAQGRQNEALTTLDRAAAMQARMPKPIGRPFPVKDVNELYGELLLQMNRASEAVSWFNPIADTNAESQPRATWTGTRVSQLRRRRQRARPPISAFSRIIDSPIQGSLKSRKPRKRSNKRDLWEPLQNETVEPLEP
jgi:hypothetical protein